MAYDTPATIAILGAGPIGLETALYARFLGYEVRLFERGRIADSVRRWGHATLFTPFRMNRSPLALSALHAQDANWRPPDDDALLTGSEYAELFLQPLAACDLLVDSLLVDTEVLSIGRAESLKGDQVGDAARRDHPFRILTKHPSQGEVIHTADIVIDCTGTYGNHNWLGQGGIPAIGERSAEASVEYGLPDVLQAQRERYAGHSVLVVGSGHSAATTVVALAQLAGEAMGTHVEWITRRPAQADREGPVRRFVDDPLTARDRLAHRANQLASHEHDGPVHHRAGTWIERIEWGGDQRRHRVHLTGRHDDVLEVDRVIAQVGYRPNRGLYSELQFHECPATDAPFQASAALLRNPSVDDRQQTYGGPATLLNPEPDFYVLGAKSHGRDSNFLISTGLEQVRDLFTIIGDRANLDLYANALSE